MLRKPCSFQMAESINKIWKAYLDPVYIINEVFLVTWDTLDRAINSAC